MTFASFEPSVTSAAFYAVTEAANASAAG
jgi:hypothetical protein